MGSGRAELTRNRVDSTVDCVGPNTVLSRKRPDVNWKAITLTSTKEWRRRRRKTTRLHMVYSYKTTPSRASFPGIWFLIPLSLVISWQLFGSRVFQTLPVVFTTLIRLLKKPLKSDLGKHEGTLHFQERTRERVRKRKVWRADDNGWVEFNFFFLLPPDRRRLRLAVKLLLMTRCESRLWCPPHETKTSRSIQANGCRSGRVLVLCRFSKLKTIRLVGRNPRLCWWWHGVEKGIRKKSIR